MNLDTAGFLAKLLAASTAISVALKFGGPLLSIPGSNVVALAIVLVPPVVLGVLLLRRWS